MEQMVACLLTEMKANQEEVFCKVGSQPTKAIGQDRSLSEQDRSQD
jgi:hypothetical protein